MLKGQLKIFFTLLLFGIINQSGYAVAQTHRYGIESGIIEYKIVGSENGTEMLFFDRWGMREARYTTYETQLYGLRHLLTIIDGEWLYRIDLDKKIGTKEQNIILKELLDHPEEDNILLAVKVIAKMGGMRGNPEEVRGKACEVWEIKAMGKQFWLWEGIMLKVQTEQGIKHTTQEATAILEGQIPEDKFIIPTDIQFIEGNIDDILLSFQNAPLHNQGNF